MEIKNRWTDKIIYESGKETIRLVCEEAVKKNADLRRADLGRADLEDADLRRADLGGADLEDADLMGADLRRADLEGADLRGADLRGADLEGANILPDLYLLKMQPLKTVLRAWKYLNNDKLPYQKSKYEIGKVYTEKDFSTDESITCDKGLNVATLQWCLNDGCDDSEFMEVEFYAKDIVAIPFATNGKLRVKRFKTLRKISRNQAQKIVDGFLEPYKGELK